MHIYVYVFLPLNYQYFYSKQLQVPAVSATSLFFKYHENPAISPTQGQ